MLFYTLSSPRTNAWENVSFRVNRMLLDQHVKTECKIIIANSWRDCNLSWIMRCALRQLWEETRLVWLLTREIDIRERSETLRENHRDIGLSYYVHETAFWMPQFIWPRRSNSFPFSVVSMRHPTNTSCVTSRALLYVLSLLTKFSSSFLFFDAASNLDGAVSLSTSNEKKMSSYCFSGQRINPELRSSYVDTRFLFLLRHFANQRDIYEIKWDRNWSIAVYRFIQ